MRTIPANSPAILKVVALVLLSSFGLAEPVRAAGPDVTVFEISGTGNYGAENGIRGYSVGTTSCNVGDAPLNWCNQVGGCGLGTQGNDHPVIAQNVYRLKNGRMDQIGASWLKHGFFSVNSSGVGCGDGSCAGPPLGSRQLGVGCTDPYGSGLNGSRPLGRKSDVNAANGEFPYPPSSPGDTSTIWNQRAAVAEADLVAASNPGARFFVEGQYVAPDDAAAGNALNNASYREVSVTAGSFNLVTVGPTVRRKAAIEAWPVIDPSVELTSADVPGSPLERFHVARKVTEVTPGTLWHYEYAVHNLNSDRSADGLAVHFNGATTFSGIGFHDIHAHSNEPYDTADWESAISADRVQWQAAEFITPANANALRWGTMYNFWFDATRPPNEIGTEILSLFKAGTPSEIEIPFGTQDGVFANGFEG